MRLNLPEDCRALVESWNHVTVKANHIEGPMDYLKQRVNMDFTQIPNKSLFESRVETDGKMGKPKQMDIEVTEDNYWVPPDEM